MLNIGDKVYLHIGELENSINKVNFNKTRLCRITDIKPARIESGEEVGIYTLQALFNEEEYNVMSNDNLWKMSSVEDLVEAIKKSKYDEDTIAAIIELVYNA